MTRNRMIETLLKTGARQAWAWTKSAAWAIGWAIALPFLLMVGVLVPKTDRDRKAALELWQMVVNAFATATRWLDAAGVAIEGAGDRIQFGIGQTLLWLRPRLIAAIRLMLAVTWAVTRFAALVLVAVARGAWTVLAGFVRVVASIDWSKAVEQPNVLRDSRGVAVAIPLEGPARRNLRRAA